MRAVAVQPKKIDVYLLARGRPLSNVVGAKTPSFSQVA